MLLRRGAVQFWPLPLGREAEALSTLDLERRLFEWSNLSIYGLMEHFAARQLYRAIFCLVSRPHNVRPATKIHGLIHLIEIETVIHQGRLARDISAQQVGFHGLWQTIQGISEASTTSDLDRNDIANFERKRLDLM